MKRLLFVDDHPIYRDGIRRTLEAGIPDLSVSVAADATEALGALRADGRIDLCLSDLRLPGEDGLALVTKIRKIDPTIAVGLLCAETSYALIEDVRAIGGVACLSKELDTADLVDAVASVFEGEEVFSHPRSEDANRPLSERRRSILLAASKGWADKQISDQLGISESTVRDHWHHIFRRLGVNNRTEAVAQAVRQRMI
ncbi:MAG: response regulator transcription factor [Beijerinckiaceae bacterium]